MPTNDMTELEKMLIYSYFTGRHDGAMDIFRGLVAHGHMTDGMSAAQMTEKRISIEDIRLIVVTFMEISVTHKARVGIAEANAKKLSHHLVELELLINSLEEDAD